MNLQYSSFFLLFIISSIIIPPSSSQFTSPQNIQTFYPFSLTPPLSPPPPTQPVPNATTRPTSSRKAVGTAIGVTAASTLVLAGILFFFLNRRSRKGKQIIRENPYRNPYGNHGGNSNNPVPPPPPVAVVQNNDFVRFNGNLKGVIVDEDGLDVLYWRKMEGEDGNKSEFEKKEVFKNNNNIIIKNNNNEESEEEKQIIQEIPLLRGKSSTSQSRIWNDIPKSNGNSFKAMEKQSSLIQVEKRPPPPPPPPVMQPKKLAPPPPPPPLPKGSILASSSSSKPPPIPPKELAMASNSKKDKEDEQINFKPLHWDKVNPNLANHSMVWDKIEGGSFKFDDNLMEALFGTVATNRKSPRNSNATTSKGEQSAPPSQIFLLDTRKSQNMAIVLKYLALSRNDIIDALIRGKGLNADTLEKLTKIAPTKEEESEILAFDGDPTRLADAESFLYHLLKSVPSAFTRFDAMLFRYNYDHEVCQFKESFQTLEFGCKELRARGLLLKLLEAILKAGNRMNAGTSRGNAQAFKLTALRKLSDVKSTDGKTTLLHFVVEEVVRAEGKRCVLNRNRSLNRSSSNHCSSNFGSSSNLENSHFDREKEYIMLGLPIVGGLSSEFSNVKKAAGIDYEVLDKSSKELTSQIAETRKLVMKSEEGQGGGFAIEMKIFLGSAEKEMKILKEEQNRVMDIVKRTTDYYQSSSSSSSNDHNQNWKKPLQLFVIVKDFLEMVDRACVDIARNVQKRKPLSRGEESSSAAAAVATPGSPKIRPSVKFPKLPPNFLSDQIKSNSSGSDQDF